MNSWRWVNALVLTLGLSGCGLVLDTSPPDAPHRCTSSADCDDGDACDGAETCVDGECKAGEAPSCDDGIACTKDACSPSAGCKHEPDDTACDSGEVCLLGVGCKVQVVCEGDADCVDVGAGGCAHGVCGPAGVCTVVLDHAACEDAFACTTDVCNEDGTCASTPTNTACSDGLACTRDVCDPEGTAHDAAGCVFTPEHARCDDGFGCTEDYCVPENEFAVAIEGCIHIPHDELCGDAVDGGGEPTFSCAADVCVPTLGCQVQARAEWCMPGMRCNLDSGECEPFEFFCQVGCGDDGDPCNGVETCVSSEFCVVEPGCPPPDDPCMGSFCTSSGAGDHVCLEWPTVACFEPVTR